MKVTMVSSQVPPVYGGAGTQALALARELVSKGVAVELLSQNQLNAPSVEVVDGVTIRRAPGERLAQRLPRRLSQMTRTVTFTLWLLPRLLTEKQDVIHLHGSYWFGLPAVLVSRLRGTPVVTKVTRLGDDDAETVSSKRIGPFPLGRLYGSPTGHAAAVIALSEEIEERARRVYPDRRIVLQPNGVDVRRFQGAHAQRAAMRRRLGIDDATKVVLFVGYLAEQKGVDVLLDAWPRVTSAADSHLVLVGPASGFYRELERDLLGALQDTSSITVEHHVPFEQMAGYYAAADAFVLPSRAEGMPNSLLEALASGLPAVVSVLPGVNDVARRSSGVRQVTPLTAEALARALIDTLASNGPPARDSRLPADFSLERVADTYVDLYTTITRRPRPVEGK